MSAIPELLRRPFFRTIACPVISASVLKSDHPGKNMNNWKQKKGLKTGGDSSNIIVTRYTVTPETAKRFKKLAPIYGSQGRALQVATEMLIRMPEVPEAETEEADSRAGVRMSLRLHERTYGLIRELADNLYQGDPGQVIAACIKVLSMKRLR